MNHRMTFASRCSVATCLLGIPLLVSVASWPAASINAEELRVPNSAVAGLPDPLICIDGTKVTDIKTWKTKRRSELLRLFETNVYGRSPGRPANMTFKVTSVDASAFGGKATRKLVTVFFTGQPDGPAMDILLYVPNEAKKPVPAFAGLNFGGNHTVCSDPGIPLSTRWFRQVEKYGISDNHATEKSRGIMAQRWQVETLMAHGFALATVYYGDIEPDDREGVQTGVRDFLAKNGAAPASYNWGAIGAWAWGLSRIMDYLETDHDIDARCVVVIGHSRLGKTALWAGAQDERFAVVISNESGCGGAGLSRRWPGKKGETVAAMNASFPHWACPNFRQFGNNEDALPVDQHELIALVAPRPVYVGSAEQDQFTDPRSEFLAVLNAAPVWRLFGLPSLGVATLPEMNRPVGNFVGYHVRSGKHEVTAYDWEQYLAFAERHLRRPR